MPKITPIEVPPAMRLKALTDETLEKIHQATLRVLAETGIRFPSEKALKIFAEAKAQVDFKKQIVKIPSDLLMDSLEKAPRSFRMASRGDPELDLYLGGTKTYIGTDGTGITTVDLETRQQRPSKKSDVGMMALICDYLPSISFYWPLVSARDTPPEVMSLHELEASFSNTEKHVHIVTIGNERLARYAVEMAIVIAGETETLKKRPPLTFCGTAVSPLGHDKGSIEAGLVFAEAGLPVRFGTMPMMCSTAPASLAGTIISGNAEILSALCLIQLANPETPVCYSFFPEIMNPYNGECYTSALQKPLFYASVVQLGHYYQLPVMSYYGSTDSDRLECWRTGKDNAIDALIVCMSSPNLVPVMGLLKAYTLLYPEKILFDNEIFCSVKAFLEGISDDTIKSAVDELMAVGPAGHFLDRDYTVQNIRNLWHEGISQQWSTKLEDFRDPQEVAIEKIQWILKSHKPLPLDENAHKELQKIIRAAEKELIN